MSISDQAINVIELDGTTKQIKLYTDISDVTEVYKDFLYNGQKLYTSTTTDPNDEYATGLKYLDDDGVVRYLCTEGFEPIAKTNGTVVINGDLSADLVVNGNLEVSGTISGNAKASGTITYGSLTGTATQNASLLECDISVDGGTLTFDADISNNGGTLYIGGQVKDTSETSTIIYGDLTIEKSAGDGLYIQGKIIVYGTIVATATVTNRTSSYHGIYVYGGTFVIESGGIVTAELLSTAGSGEATKSYGLYITNSGIVTVRGELNTISSFHDCSALYVGSSSAITVSGVVNATGNNTGSRGLNIDGTFTIENGGTVNATAVYYGLYLNGTFTIESGGTATIGDTSILHAVYILSSGVLTVGGTLYTIALNDSRCFTNSGTATTTGSGKIYINGVLQ